MRRLFIIRRDLNLSPGKLAAMVGHCCEAYWTNILKRCSTEKSMSTGNGKVHIIVSVDENVWTNYALGIFTKTICEADNLNKLKKAEATALELGLVQGEDWGYINDCCKTELKPENEDGTTTVGMWFCPLDDEKAKAISRKYKLYGFSQSHNKEHEERE